MLNVDDLLSSNRDVKLEFGPGKTLNISYDPNAITSNMLTELSRDSASLCEALEELIVKWDLEGKDGQPYPASYDNLANMKLVIVNQIFEAIIEDAFPKRESTTSSDTTTRRGRRMTN